MARKGGGPPKERHNEELWTQPEADAPLDRSLDKALQRDDDDDEEPDFIYGDIVHDTEADDPIALVVVNVPGLSTQEWEYEEETLADRSPKYPDDDDVIVVVPLDVLDVNVPDWDERETAIPREDLVKEEIPFAPFPSLRLILKKESHLRD